MPDAEPAQQTLLAGVTGPDEGLVSENTRLAVLTGKAGHGAQGVRTLHSPVPRHEVLEGIWLDYKPDSGVEVVLTLEPGGLRLDTATTGVSPWFSLSYDLSIGRLRDARYLLNLIVAASRGPARFRVCIRYHLPEGFRDVFARELVVLNGPRQENLIVNKVDPDLANAALAAEVLFFFDGRSFDVTLHQIEAHII